MEGSSLDPFAMYGARTASCSEHPLDMTHLSVCEAGPYTMSLDEVSRLSLWSQHVFRTRYHPERFWHHQLDTCLRRRTASALHQSPHFRTRILRVRSSQDASREALETEPQLRSDVEVRLIRFHNGVVDIPIDDVL